MDVARHRKDFTILLGRQTGGNQGTTAPGGFHDHGSKAHAADNPVAHWKVARRGFGVQFKFSDHSALISDWMKEVEVLRWVHPV